jgi:Transposase DDE domain group 1
VQARTIRPKITVTADGQGVASRVGSRLLAGLGAMTGLDQAFGDAVGGGRQRRSAHDPGRVLTDLAVLLADGGETISDLGVLRSQPGLFGQVASTATAWRVLEKHRRGRPGQAADGPGSSPGAGLARAG